MIERISRSAVSEHKASSRILPAILISATFLVSAFAFLPAPVFATTNPACAATITVSTTLSGNVGPCSGDGLYIGASGIVLDCAGYTITGISSGYVGISLLGSSGHGIIGTTVENCNLKGFDIGISVAGNFGSAGNTLTGNSNVDDSSCSVGSSGFNLVSTSGNTITGNTARSLTSCGAGFSLSTTSRDTLSGNTATGNGVGFQFQYRPVLEVLSKNTAYNNSQSGFATDSFGSNNDTFIGNSANGNGNYGFILSGGVRSSANNTFSKNTASGNKIDGFYIGSPNGFNSNDTFSGNTASNNGNSGFWVASGQGYTFKANIANSNTQYGFAPSYGKDLLSGNTANNNGKAGFDVYGSTNDVLSGNTANNNIQYGFYFWGSGSHSNTLTGNTANRNLLYGYHDTTTGTGTAGTANTYTRNSCSKNGLGGSSPKGLCPNTPTTTTVKCLPSSLTSGTPTTCTVTVTDTGSGTPVTPLGKVKFGSSLTGTFSSTSCTLSGSGGTSSCSVTFTPTSTGAYIISAKYTGDSSHLGSKGKFKLTVT